MRVRQRPKKLHKRIEDRVEIGERPIIKPIGMPVIAAMKNANIARPTLTRICFHNETCR